MQPEGNTKQMFEHESFAHSSYPKITFASKTHNSAADGEQFPIMRDEPEPPACGRTVAAALKDGDAGTVVPLNACEWTVAVSW